MADTIIIIRGNSGSGKTTVANKLCDELGAECMLLSKMLSGKMYCTQKMVKTV